MDQPLVAQYVSTTKSLSKENFKEILSPAIAKKDPFLKLSCEGTFLKYFSSRIQWVVLST